jgi:hypothetical protein
VRINEELLDRKVAAPVKKTEINDLGNPPRRPRDTILFTKVGTNFRRQVAVAQSVQFACGLRATEFVCLESSVAKYDVILLVRRS